MKTAKKVLLVTAICLLPLLLSGCSETDPTGSGLLSELLGSRSESIHILLLLTVLALAPSILIMLTGFTRIIIVLSLVRNGLGLQQMPPNQVLIGLALFLTLFVMQPVINEIKVNAYEPYVAEEITEQEAIEKGMEPIRDFMLRQTYKTDLDFFVSASDNADDITIDNIPNTTLIPAFITSEIKRGFEIGFFIYIPFIVIDMVVASVLMSMGMMMLPPAIISLPFKLLLFVLVDGWTLTVKTLLTSFG